MVKIICKQCNKEFEVIPSRQNTAKFCCRECADQWIKDHRNLNCTCSQCGSKFHMKPYQMNRYPRNMGFFCSKECASKYREEWFKGENNHQFGLIGDKNSSFKGNYTIKKNHKLTETLIYAPERPDVDKNRRITRHRYAVVTNYDKFDKIYFNIVNEFRVLKDGLQVHHLDWNHNNDNIDNLSILSRSEHTKLHNSIKELAWDFLEQIIGVFKSGELLENPEVDNQQPSLSGNTFEGSETNSRVLTSNVADSNTDTSAVLNQIKILIDDYIVQTKNITKNSIQNTINELLESEIKSSE